MERVLRGTAATIEVTFYVGETATNPSPDSATVEILRADGTVLVASTAAGDSGTGKFSHILTPVHTALLDRLTARWTATLGGVAQTVETHVEIVGGFLFSLVQARRDPDLADATAYPTARLIEARTEAEDALEHACGVAFVPRYERESLSGDNGVDLVLRWPRVRSVRAASVDGAALTAPELAELKISPIGAYRETTWASGTQNVVVAYEHGYDFPPGEISRAALRLAKHYLVPAQFDDRVIRAEAGEESFLFASPGTIPEVDQVISHYSWHAGVA